MANKDMMGEKRLTPAEERKKAIGNPNKNVHAKKKNSNYGGYNASPAAKKNAQETRQVPKWISRTILILSLILIVMIILQFTVFKDNELMNNIESVYLAGVLMFMYYTRFETFRREDTTFGKILSVVILLGALLYAATGINGIINLLK